MKPIKTGIIGMGMMGFAQLRNCFSALPEYYEITCLCDNHEQNLKRSLDWCVQCGIEAAGYADWRKMLAQGDFELAVIVTPDFLHEEMAVECLKSGKHLRLEKPMATTLPGCARIMEAFEVHRPVVQVGFELRYANLTEKILHDLPQLGRLKMIWCHEFRHPFLKKEGSTPDWIICKELTGGTLLEKNCHHFDLFNMLANARPVSIYASGDNETIYSDTDILDNAFVTIEYENGVRAMLSLCMFSPEKKSQPNMYALELGLLGDNGRMEMRDDNLYLWDRGAASEQHSIFLRSNFEAHTDDILPSLVDLADCIRNNRQPDANLRAGINSNLVALAAELSVEQSRIVSMKEMEQKHNLPFLI